MTRILVFVISTLGLVPPGAVFGGAPQLVVLIADRGSVDRHGGIYKLNIHHMNVSRVPIRNLNTPIAIDYDQVDGLIYFSDITTEELRRVDTSGENDVIVAKLNSTSSPEGIALDSQARLVFYTDNGNDLIGRVDMVSLNHKVIVNTGLDKPRGIVADTRNKKLYWVDFGANPKIETSDYNGEQKSTLIYSGLARPYGITLDENAGRLYWTDADGTVDSVLVTGKERRTILSEDKETMNDISLFNDFIYYTDFHDELIHSSTIGKSVQGFTLSAGYLVNPTGIHVYSPNFNITAPCSYGQFGPDCSPCGKCSFTDPCEKTTGICLGGCQPGYTQETCDKRCSPGTYGEDCLSRCSDNCRTGSVCDFIDGSCPAGCQSEWSGYNCTERIFESTTDEISSPSIGLIVGAVVGGVVIIAVVVVVVVVLIVRRKRKQEESYDKCDDIAMGQDNNDYTSLDFVNSNTT